MRANVHALSASLLRSVLLALTGCTPAPELTPFERASGSAAAQAWLTAGLPASADDCDMRSFSIVRPPASEFVLRCGSATAAACLDWGGGGPLRPRHPVVVLAPGQEIEDNGEPIIHELMHALWTCAAVGPPLDPGNRGHLDPRVWVATGGQTSAQARARAIVLGTAQEP